jgi:uncharacterized membrane protein
VLQAYTEDRSNQLVLGVFIGTFTYALLVLRTVRSSLEDHDRFVPSISVTVALLLALLSIGFLIYFVNHVARSIQAETIIDRAARNALRVVDNLFPQELGEPAAPGSLDDLVLERQATVRAPRAGYIQGADEDRVLELAERHDLLVRMERRIGEFVLEGDPLLTVQPANVPDAVCAALSHVLTLGAERTRHQDLERSLVELTDIGIRALSPGSNDPTTAKASIDRLAQVIAVLSSRSFPPRVRVGRDGIPRFVARRSDLQEIVARAYGPLAHHAANDPFVLEHLRASLRVLEARAAPSRRHVFTAQLSRLPT